MLFRSDEYGIVPLPPEQSSYGERPDRGKPDRPPELKLSNFGFLRMSDEFKCSTTNTRYEAPTAPDLIGPDGRLSFEGLENCFSLGGTDQFHRNRALRIIDADPKHRNPHPPPSHHK